MTEVTYHKSDNTYQVPGGPRVSAIDIEKAHTLSRTVVDLRAADPGSDEDAEPMPDIMQFFTYAHLPPHLQSASKPFYDLAHVILCLPNNAERSVALRKLLEAKDAAVRAKVSK